MMQSGACAVGSTQIQSANNLEQNKHFSKKLHILL